MFIEAVNTLQIQAAKGRSDTLGAQLTHRLDTLRDTPGCISYSAMRSHLDVDLWIITGHWKSRAAMEAHFDHPALNDFVGSLLKCNVVSRIGCNSFFTVLP